MVVEADDTMGAQGKLHALALPPWPSQDASCWTPR